MDFSKILRTFAIVVCSCLTFVFRAVESALAVKCPIGKYFETGLEVCRNCSEICRRDIPRRLEQCLEEITCRGLWPQDDKPCYQWLYYVPAVVMFVVGLALTIKFCWDKKQFNNSSPPSSKYTSLQSNLGHLCADNGAGHCESCDLLMVDVKKEVKACTAEIGVQVEITHVEITHVDVKCGPGPEEVLVFPPRDNNEASEYAGNQYKPEAHTVLLPGNSTSDPITVL